MHHHQLTLVTGCLAGFSLLLHLLSAGNFLPDNEVRLLGSIFWYIHYWLNFVARGSLLGTTAAITIEVQKPNVIINFLSISQRQFKLYLTRMLAIATFCVFIRFLTPGPVNQFSFFYKLSFLCCLSAMIVTVVDDGGTSMISLVSPIKRKLGIRKKRSRTSSDCEDDDDVELKRSESIEGLPPTKRQLTAMELLQTETTYIRNLKIMIEVYKQPLEKAVEEGNPILAMEDIKNIFNGISEILAVHTKIHQELSNVIPDWNEDCHIASIITKYQSQLTTAYPPYVNFFDMGKDLILTQQKSNPKFADFIIHCFNNPLCLKQPLDALMIRPVQRLPSMSLLISDLQKRTPENISDHKELEKAKESLKKVLSHINEDKRKTEGKLKIFDIIYEVEACPPDIVASHRLFVARSNVTSLNEGLYRAGDRLALYLLTDMIEVSKFKNKPENVLLKHVRTIPLDDIKLVIDINDSDESVNMFAIQLVDEPSTKSNIQGNHHNPNMDKLCVCQTLDGRVYKQDFLKKLEAQIRANHKKGEKVLQKMDHTQVQPMLKRGGSRIFRKGRGKAKRD